MQNYIGARGLSLWGSVGLCLSLLLGGAGAARADMTVNVGKMSVDGLEVRQLTCSLKSGGGLFASMMVVGALSKQKKALDSCTKDGAAFLVSFAWTGGKTADVKVEKASKPAGSKCVAAAMGKIKAPAEGSCTVTILTGNTAKAEAAAAAWAPAKAQE